MKDDKKTKQQLIKELATLRRKFAALEEGEKHYSWTEPQGKEQAGLLKLVMESLPHPFYVIDASNYRIILANSASRLGVLSDDSTCYEITHMSDKPCGLEGHPCPLEEIKRSKQPVISEHIHYDKDGNPKNVEVYGYPVFDGEGNVSSIIEYTLDITDRKNAEKALRKSEDRYRDLYENAPTAYFTISTADGSIIQYNTAALNLFGYNREAISSIKVFDLYADTPHGLVKARKVFNDLKKGQSIKDVELQVKHIEGHTIWVSLSSEPIKDSEGEIIESRFMMVDIADRKRVEEAIKESSEKIKLFAYSIAHDLKNPAIGLHGLTKLLHENFADGLDEKGRDYCGRILKISEQIVVLVDQINEFISTKESELQIDSLDIKEILKVIREGFSTQIENRKIRWSEPDHIPPIKADRLSIMRALRNLVDNALKYGGDTLSKINIDHRESSASHILSVTDDGIGIEMQDDNDIFNPFIRNKTSRDVHGSGLGLAIVREIAEKHGGQVGLESGRKKGITFHISIAKRLRPSR
ncbi:PAS domain-containing protein [Thermodesulfobacteriota bacterium]